MLIELSSSTVFKTQTVDDLLPLINKITSTYKVKVENKMLILEQISSSKISIINELEVEIDTMIAEWKSKMRRLGAKPAGLWSLDFDNGNGYFCWKYPEAKIAFQHGYKEGFTGRKPITESLLQFE